MARPSPYWTAGGFLFVGDREDDDAPLLKIELCNEAATWSEQELGEWLVSLGRFLLDGFLKRP